MNRHTIEIDAANWGTALAFYNSILRAIGAPPEHGTSIDALVDSMVYGGMNTVEPPYTVRIYNLDGVPKDVFQQVQLAKRAISEARAERRTRDGRDVDVQIDME